VILLLDVWTFLICQDLPVVLASLFDCLPFRFTNNLLLIIFILQFLGSLKDNLNAEVALGTVTNVKEACAWLGYTYLFIRMKTNPLVYGIAWEEVSFFSIIQIFDVFKDIRVT
jgi:hypothetical protein